MTNYQKISPTARLVAKTRAKYTDMPFAKEIAEQVEAIDGNSAGFLALFKSFFEALGRHYPLLLVKAPLFESRYLAVNSALDDYPHAVILELAGGLSPRGLEYTRNGGRIYFETDLEDVVRIKREIANNIGRSDRHFIDTLDALSLEELMTAGENIRSISDSPIVVVNEGLMMYFDDEEQARLRDNIYTFLKEYSPDGAWITPDFMLKYRTESIVLEFLKRLGQFAVRSATRRAINRFESPEDIEEYLSRFKFEHVKVPAAESLSSVAKTGIDPSQVEKIIRNSYRTYVMTL